MKKEDVQGFQSTQNPFYLPSVPALCNILGERREAAQRPPLPGRVLRPFLSNTTTLDTSASGQDVKFLTGLEVDRGRLGVNVKCSAEDSEKHSQHLHAPLGGEDCGVPKRAAVMLSG